MLSEVIKSERINVQINYIYKGLHNFNLTSTLWVVYMISKGLSLSQIGIAEGLFHAIILCTEVPTGIIADYIGRKLSRVLASFFEFFGTILMIFAVSSVNFYLAFIIMGLATTLESGAGDALIYDSLKSANNECLYYQIAGKISFVQSVSQGLALLVGGIVADVNYLYVFICTAIVQSLNIIVSFLFKETYVDIQIKKPKITNFIKDVIDFLKKDQALLYSIILNGLIDTAASVIFFYGREIFRQSGFNQSSTGLLYMIYFIVAALTGYLISLIINPKNIKRLILYSCLLFFLILVLFSLTSHLLNVIFFLLIGFTVGMILPLFSIFINERSPSFFRATLLSVNGAFFSLWMVVFFPIVGIVADYLSLKSALKIFSLIIALTVFLGSTKLYLRINKEVVN